MRRACLVAVVVVASLADPAVRASEAQERAPLGPTERAAVLALIDAVDTAQMTDAAGDATLEWDNHILKAASDAYVPFRVVVRGAADAFKSAAMYVRAVSRPVGIRASEERSFVRDWLMRKGDAPPVRQETVFIGPGEMPVGGPATSSSRRTTQAPAEASAVLSLQTREYERQKAAAEAAKKRAETKERDPYRFAFEDYDFAELKAAQPLSGRALERALSLPAGEYDVYVALLDRARLKTSSPVIRRRTVTIPDYWNDELAISSLIFASEVRTLDAPLKSNQQRAHPYTFGRAEVIPAARTTFTKDDVLSVVFQICNYGAPDVNLSADYAFYRVDGERTLFNRTQTQQLTDSDLPPPLDPWQTQAFTMQAVPLKSFPAGQYELEVTVRDRATRGSAKASATFTVE